MTEHTLVSCNTTVSFEPFLFRPLLSLLPFVNDQKMVMYFKSYPYIKNSLFLSTHTPMQYRNTNNWIVNIRL